MNVVIIGCGMMGSALSVPLADNNNNVNIVGTPLDRDVVDFAIKNNRQKTMDRALPSTNHYFQYEEFDKAIENADFAISGVSSFGVDWLVNEVLPRLPKDLPILSVTKGLIDHEDGSLETVPDYVKRVCGREIDFCAVGGPCTAYELSERYHTCVTFCGENQKTLEMMKKVMETDYYHITLSDDIIGVEAAVALKNGYAMAVASAIGDIEQINGIGCPEIKNPQAAIFGQSVQEMYRIIKDLGGNPEQIMLAAGDLYVTVCGGRSRRLGILLGRGYTFEEAKEELKGSTLEAAVIAQRVARALKIRSAKGEINEKDFPIMMHMGEVLAGECKVNMPYKYFR